MSNKLIIQPKRLFLLIALSAILMGCQGMGGEASATMPAQLPSQVSPTLIPVSTVTQPPSIDPTFTECLPQNQLVMDEVEWMQWSPDKQEIFIRKQNADHQAIWFTYWPQSGQLHADAAPAVSTPTLQNLIPAGFDLFSVSPSGRWVILSHERYGGPTPTPIITPGLGGPWPTLYTTLFLWEMGQETVLIGEISGVVDGLLWSPDETILVIQVDEFSASVINSSWVWMVDLEKLAIDNLFPIEGKKATIVDFLPGKKIIRYYLQEESFDQRRYHLMDLETRSVEVLPFEPATFSWWTQNGRKIVLIDDKDPKGEQLPGLNDFMIYTFDTDTRKLEPAFEEAISIGYYGQDAVSVAPDQSSFAYLTESGRLMLFSFCK